MRQNSLTKKRTAVPRRERTRPSWPKSKCRVQTTEIEQVFTPGKISGLYSATPPENVKFARANKKAPTCIVTVRRGFRKETFIHQRNPLQDKEESHISQKIAELVCFSMATLFSGLSTSSFRNAGEVPPVAGGLFFLGFGTSA